MEMDKNGMRLWQVTILKFIYKITVLDNFVALLYKLIKYKKNISPNILKKSK